MPSNTDTIAELSQQPRKFFSRAENWMPNHSADAVGDVLVECPVQEPQKQIHEAHSTERGDDGADLLNQVLAPQ